MKPTLLALALAAAPLAAHADGPKMDPGRPMENDASLIRHFDRDGDGRVSRQESIDAAVDRANRRFEQLDANKDGYLTQDEMNAARKTMRERVKERAGEHWKAADKDGDGAISRSEAEAGMPMLARRFDQLDANKDGKITRDEMPQGKRMDAVKPPARPSE
ncbi:MAG: EF-hand domain-containing protein [Steroidobacteraceae bacterium]